jgi:hypothetical protein
MGDRVDKCVQSRKLRLRFLQQSGFLSSGVIPLSQLGRTLMTRYLGSKQGAAQSDLASPQCLAASISEYKGEKSAYMRSEDVDNVPVRREHVQMVETFQSTRVPVIEVSLLHPRKWGR